MGQLNLKFWNEFAIHHGNFCLIVLPFHAKERFLSSELKNHHSCSSLELLCSHSHWFIMIIFYIFLVQILCDWILVGWGKLESKHLFEDFSQKIFLRNMSSHFKSVNSHSHQSIMIIFYPTTVVKMLSDRILLVCRNLETNGSKCFRVNSLYRCSAQKKFPLEVP